MRVKKDLPSKHLYLEGQPSDSVPTLAYRHPDGSITSTQIPSAFYRDVADPNTRIEGSVRVWPGDSWYDTFEKSLFAEDDEFEGTVDDLKRLAKEGPPRE